MAARDGVCDEELLSSLIDMGFERAAAISALRATGNRNAEAAVLWLCGPDAAGADEPATGVPAAGAYAVVQPDGTPAPAWVARVDGEFKVVLCVVSELRMSVGKVAAQAAHAAVGLLRLMQEERTPWLHAWEGAGEKTVVLDVPTGEAAAALATKAAQLGLPLHAVLDAGRTEVAPGSFTVLAIGGASSRCPGPSSVSAAQLTPPCVRRACRNGGPGDGAPAHAPVKQQGRRFGSRAERAFCNDTHER